MPGGPGVLHGAHAGGRRAGVCRGRRRSHHAVLPASFAKETALYLELFAALAHKRRTSALADQNLQRIQQSGFTRARFACHHSKGGAWRKRCLVDQRHIANMHFINHGNPF